MKIDNRNVLDPKLILKVMEICKYVQMVQRHICNKWSSTANNPIEYN